MPIKKLPIWFPFFLNGQSISCQVINDGKNALYKRKKNEKYNVILLNLAMPELSGYNSFNNL